MEKFKKVIASMVLMTFLITTMPIQVLAQDIGTWIQGPENGVKIDGTNAESTEVDSTVKILQEDEEKRESNVKHFILENKTYEAVVYDSPVHYLEDGKWKDIDNSLAEVVDESLETDNLSSEETKLDQPKSDEVKQSTPKPSEEGSTSPGEVKPLEKQENTEVDKTQPKEGEENNGVDKTQSPDKQESTETNTVKSILKQEDNAVDKVKDSVKLSEEEKNKELNDKEKLNDKEELSDKEKLNDKEKLSDTEQKKENEIPNIENNKSEKVDNNETVDKIDKNILQNRANNFKFKLAKKGDSKKLVSLSKDKYEISWSLQNASKVAPKITEIDEKKLNEEIEKRADYIISKSKVLAAKSKREKELQKQNVIENEKKKTLKNLSSSVNYFGILPNVDLNYNIISDKIKENLIINKKIDDATFIYNLEVKNLIAVKQENNTIVFYDKDDKSKEVFIIKAPYMFDSKGEESTDIEVKVEETKKGYTLTVTPSKEWLNDSKRAYPVTVDPDVVTDPSSVKIIDTFVASNDTENKALNQYLRVGYNSSIGTTRSYLSFNLPKLTSADMVIGAQLEVALQSASVANQINVHKVTSAWKADSSNNLGWNNQPSYDAKVVDYSVVSGYDNWFVWNVINVAKEWYATGNNYGLMLKSNNESTSDSIFWSSDVDNAYSYARPKVKITYISNVGLENYWSYHSQDVGRAGTGFINDYTGNLTFTHGDFSLSSERLPINISHVYNANELKNRNWSRAWMGRGWSLNIYERVDKVTLGPSEYLVYTDRDGTKHYFRDDAAKSVLNDELNLGLTLTKESDGAYTVKDKDGNKSYFYGDGYLSAYIDKNNNRVTANYTSFGTNAWYISSLTDSSGRVVKLNYDANGLLLSIQGPDNKLIEFMYNSIDLIGMRYADGQTVGYTYDGNGNLTSATNIDGYSVTYEYNTIDPLRVKKAYEKSNGVDGKSLTINYVGNSTEFTDFKGRKETYLFDNGGRVINIKDSDDYALYNEFNDAGNETKLTNQSKTQKTIINYLQNTSFEHTSAWSSSYGTIDFYSTEESSLGNRSLKLSSTTVGPNKYASQYATLTKGKEYVLSAMIKTIDLSTAQNAGACLTIGYKDNAGASKYVKKFVTGTSQWKREEVSFKLPADSTDDKVWIGLELINTTGSAYFDNVQLEDGKFFSRYNMIQNGDFTLWNESDWLPPYWTGRNTEHKIDYIAYDTVNHPKDLDVNSMKFIGHGSSNKAIYQEVPAKGAKGDSFVLSGWAKADAVDVRDGRYFELSLGFIKADGTIQWGSAPFSDELNQWQYVSKAAVAPFDYTGLGVFICYYGEENTGYFDGIQLFKEEFGQTYTYDSKGNLRSTVDLAKQNSNLEYDGNDNLKKAIDPKGNNYKYDYDANNNMTTATTAENVVYSFQYDANGNVKTATTDNTVDSLDLFIQGSTTYRPSGNYIDTVKDPSGNTTTFNYDETKDQLNSVTDGKGKTTNYQYGTLKELTSVSKTADGKEVKNVYGYDKDRIKSITHNNFSYNFGYDDFGNNTSVSVGTAPLINNTYEPKSGNLLTSTYGNGQVMGNEYDALDRLVRRKYNSVSKYEYEYDKRGNLALHKDLENGIDYRYTYDTLDRLAKVNDSKGREFKYDYDVNNNLNTFFEKVNGTNYNTRYTYDKDNKPKTITYDRNSSNNGLRDKLIAQYTFDNDDASDSSGNGYSGVIQGSPTYEAVANGRGKGIRLDGVSQWVQLPDFDTTSDFTLSMFVKPDTAGNMSFVSKADAAGVNQLWTGQWDGKFDIKLNSTPDVVGGQATSNYQHVLLTVRKINGTQSELKLYKDKVAVFTSTVNTVFSNNTGKGWTIGQDFDGEALSDYFKGIIDEVSFYKGVLSTEEINSVYSNSSNIIVKNYDTIGRIKTSVINNNYTTSYDYKDGAAGTGTGSTTNVTSKITNKNSSIAYTYDKNGNIETITDNGNLIRYTYNELNEVIREDNAVLNKTIVYSYDIGGNILSKTEYQYTPGALGTAIATIGYTYDETWKDKLASYNGKAITYDAIGNPLTYNGNTYTWEMGRRLKTINGNGNAISYKYNDSGIRTEKTVNGVTTKYSLVGDKVTFENNGSEKLYYTYDSNGKLLSMNVTSPTNILEGSSDIGIMDQSPNNAGVTIGEFTNPKTNNKVKAIRLNKDASIPNIWSPYIGLKTNTNYVLEFDYWADADDVKFDVDLFPDDLPQSFPTAKKTVQRYKWEFSSPSVNMTATMLRFFNDTVQVNPANIYITNIKLYESSKTNETSKEYFYVRNAQNDIIGLVNGAGDQVVSYVYDTWGKLVSISGNLAGSIGELNPHRYRGYRYDTETGLYYLQSRYYNPEWGRFINADGLAGTTGDLLSHNMFAYCKNNPVNMVDYDGQFAWFLIPIAIAVAEVFAAVTAFIIIEAPAIINQISNIMTTYGPQLQGASQNLADKISGDSSGSSSSPDPGKKPRGNSKPSKSNYRDTYKNLNPNMPENYQVHHTLPQKYESIMGNSGVNIHEAQYLRGVDPKIHSKITTEWVRWDKGLGRLPTSQEVIEFANQINSKYGQYWYKP